MMCNEIQRPLAEICGRYPQGQIVVVLDRRVAYETAYPTLRLEVSEEHKDLSTLTQIWDFFFAHHLTRSGLVICIGGGVLTDMAGLAAAMYKRGVDYVNIPTTLLSMVDASSGGKTAINYHGLKNSIGVFAEPVETLICPNWLHTLPAEQLLSGYAEMLKTGLIEDNVQSDKVQGTKDSLWNRLLNYDLEALDEQSLAPLIADCVAVKNRIVSSDPHEQGARKALNFGHTFGHALEELSFVHRTSPLHPMLHGYAVLYGMIAELYLSVTRLGCPREPLQHLTQLMLHYYGKPQCKCSDREQLIALMQQDKKNERAAEINCTLIRSIGEPVVNQVITPDEASEAFDYLFSL